MKMFRFLAVALAMVATIASCTPDSTMSVIRVGQTQVALSTNGEAVTIGYMIENGIDGESLTATTSADWLHINTERVRSIEFSADVNTSNEQREAKVILSYKGAADVEITVTQSPYDSPLRIEIVAVDSTVLTFSVYSSDENIAWIPYVMPKYYFDTYKNEQQIYEDDIAYLREYAEYFYEMTLEEFLPEVVEVGTAENIKYEELDPSTEYVVYTYGLDANGNRTTDLVWEQFTTGEVYDGDITYEFIVSEDDFVLEFTIVPSEGSVHYYNGIVPEQTLNKWKEEFGTDDIRTAIQKGDIEANIEDLINADFLSSRGSYYDMFDESGKMDYGWENVDASTKYIIYACKWNENCELIGEVGIYEHFTQPIAPSNNVIDCSIVEVTQTSVKVRTVPTIDEDWYTVMPVTSELIEGMSDEEIFNFLKTNSDYLLKEYKTQGYRERKFTRLHPDTDYTVVWFGYHGGTMTTQMGKTAIKTIASGDPKDCTFAFLTQPEEEEAWIEIYPSDKGHFYYWIVCPAYYTVDDLKEFIEYNINTNYEGYYKSFVSWELSQGDATATVSGLYSGTDYKVATVIMDYDNFEYLSDVHFSEVFTTKVRAYTDLEINLNYGPYYDLNALIDAGHTELKTYLGDGDAVLPVSIEITGGVCNEFYYAIWSRDLTDSDPVTGWTDEMFYKSLCDPINSCTSESANFFVPYDKDMTIVAIAYDERGLPTPIKRELVHFTEDGASPVEGFDKSNSAAKSAAMPVMQAAKVGTKQRAANVQPRIVEVEEIDMEVAMAQNEAAREEKLRAEFEARKVAKKGSLSRCLRR